MTFEVKNEQQTAEIISRESEEIPPTPDRMASGIGNWELDAIAEDERFQQKLDDTYLQDLARSVGIVLQYKKREFPAAEKPKKWHSQKCRGRRGGSSISQIDGPGELSDNNTEGNSTR